MGLSGNAACISSRFFATAPGPPGYQLPKYSFALYKIHQPGTSRSGVFRKEWRRKNTAAADPVASLPRA